MKTENWWGRKQIAKQKTYMLPYNTINVNGPKSLIKRQRLSDWIKKQDPTLPIRNGL